MKLSATIFFVFLFLLSTVSSAMADKVYLKSGYVMEGVISQENDEYVELEINAGKVKFYRGQFDRLERSSQDENNALGESWKREALRKQAEENNRQEEIEAENKKLQEEKEAAPKNVEASLQENHLIVDAVLNGAVKAKLLVDTGASFVVLSSEILQKLNTKLDTHMDAKMSLADGREVPAKLFKLDSVSIGEIKASDVETAVIYQKNAFKGFDGLLGMSFLKLFKFAISPDKGSLVLERKVNYLSTPRGTSP